MRRLNGYKVIEIRWLSGIENFVSERDDFIFNSFRNFQPVKRLGIGVMCRNFGAWTTVLARDDLFEISEAHSTESCNSQAWSV